MGCRTPLFHAHVADGAKIVDFGGWDMPLHYGSQIEEHHAVRRRCAVFDVSHMGVVDLEGPRVRAYLEHLLANDPGRLTAPGKALYSCMLLPAGGVIDDLIAYFLAEDRFRLVVNAGTRDKDLRWLHSHAGAFAVRIVERRDLAMLAIQGPEAQRRTLPLLDPALRQRAADLGTFQGAEHGDWMAARTGYTGEDGLELMLPAGQAADLWRALRAAGVQPAGLGARDTLRLEAGMNLYGNDMDETHHPLESGLAWTVAFEPAARRFIGRKSLEALRGGSYPRLVGLMLEDRGVLRSHQAVFAADGAGPIGEITSGTFSPTLNRSIALARITPGIAGEVRVDIRGKLHRATVAATPFVRRDRPAHPEAAP